MNDFTNKDPRSVFLQRAQRCDDLFKDIDCNITTIIEATRVKYGFTRDEYSKLLGVSPSTYTSSVNKWKRIKSPIAILRFCYIFGYDLETLVASPIITITNDFAVTELGVRVSGLSDKSLTKMVEYIDSLDESKEVRKGFSIAIEAYKQSRHECIKLAAHKPSDE